jgi:patatin-related protein
MQPTETAGAVPPDDVPTAAHAPRPIRLVQVRAGQRLADRLRNYPGAAPDSGRTLRVALAMRGGVSLAVWIGGAVAELDLLRRIHLYEHGGGILAFVLVTPETPLTAPVLERLAVYARLMEQAGYDRVEFDLLAGASAGGLNAVVYSVAQRAGTGVDSLLDTWSEVGGFWGLLHPPGSRGIRALMQGEAYFRARTREQLFALYDTHDRHPDLVAEYTSVDLSATVIDAHDEYEEDANEGRGHFRFVGSDEHSLDNLIPRRDSVDYPGKTKDDLENLDRLALAARSTSSLPGGFEPAEIDSTTGRAGVEPRDMRFAFGVHRSAQRTPYRIVDGAVFDNVPIERALRAAKLRRSDRLADRAMIFLDPEPDAPLGGEQRWDPNASRFFRAIGAMFSRSFRRESVAREAAELQRFNAAQLIESGRRESAASLIAAAPWDAEALVARRRAYLRSLGMTLADHLAEAISLPSAWQLQSTLSQRRRYLPVSRVDLADLPAHALASFERAAAADPATPARSVLALADAANSVLAWTRALEAVPDSPGSRRRVSITDVRELAYAALTDATNSRDMLTALVLDETQDLAARRAAPNAADFDRWLTTWFTASDTIDTDQHWRALDAAVIRLAEATKAVDRTIAHHDHAVRRAWTQSPWSALSRVPRLNAVDLPPVLNAGGIPAALSNLRYWSIGVDEVPDQPASFTTLVLDRRHAVLQRLMRTWTLTEVEVATRLRAAADDVALDRQAKLAGYGFGNFLGFLAREWRVNDWWWGRLDASAGIVRFLASSVPGAPEPVLEVGRVQDAVLEECDEPRYMERGVSALEPEPEPEPEGSPDHGDVDDVRRLRRRTRLRSGTDTIWNLDPGYRFAIASRAVRLVDRVVIAPVTRVIAIVTGALLFLLRPVLVFVPTLLDPPRLALAAAFIAAAAWLTSWSAVPSPEPVPIGIAIASCGALLGLLVWGVASARLRWRKVVTASEGDLAGLVARAASRAWVPTLRYGIVAVASLFPLAISIIQSNALMAILCFGVTSALVATTVYSATSARRTDVPGRRLRTSLMIGTFALLGGILPLVQLIVQPTSGPLAPGPDWYLLVLVAAGIAVAITLTYDWLPIARTPLVVSRGVNWLTITVAAAIAGCAAWFLVAFLDQELDRLLQDALQTAAFVVVWANAVWWLPDLRRAESDITDRVVRAHLD